jgi:DNA-binding MarR family transcriptional regulator
VSTSPRALSPLGAALRGYLDARSTALLTARKELGINELDARAFVHILENPGIRPVEVKNVFGLTSAGVTVLIDRLVERDVVRRDPDPDDRRSVRLVATIDLGDSPWSALTSFDDGFEAAVLGLGSEECDSSVELITRLTRLAGNR